MLFNSSANGLRRIAAAVATASVLLGSSSVVYAEAKPKQYTITIEAMRFIPETLEVHVGDTVIWKNKDFFPHTATADDHRFDSRDIAPNGSWKFVARKKGTFPYWCAIHPSMKGTLIVE